MTQSQFVQECLKHHNTFRSFHNSPELVIDFKLNDFAQDWALTLAEKDRAEHRKKNNYGENIFSGYFGPGYELEAQVPVKIWYDEITAYEFGKPQPQTLSAVGHFTQLVWKNSRKLGVGIAKSKTGIYYVVCNYDPPGNVRGKYAQNVLRPTAQRDATRMMPMLSGTAVTTARPNSEANAQGVGGSSQTPKPIVSVVLAASAVPSSVTSKSSRSTMKPPNRISPETLRAWSSWLTKVVQIVSCEWEEWLLAHINLALRLNEYLLKAAELAKKSGFVEREDSCSTLERKESRATTNGSEYSMTREGLDAIPKESNLCLPACHCTKDEEEGSKVNSKPVEIPANECEMYQVIEDFDRNARKYRILYRNWSKMTRKVLEEMAKPLYVPLELDFFQKIDNICAEDDCESDDEEVIRTDEGLEFITFGNQNLMYDLNGGCDMDCPSQQASQILSVKDCPSNQLGSVKSAKTISTR